MNTALTIIAAIVILFVDFVRVLNPNTEVEVTSVLGWGFRAFPGMLWGQARNEASFVARFLQALRQNPAITRVDIPEVVYASDDENVWRLMWGGVLVADVLGVCSWSTFGNLVAGLTVWVGDILGWERVRHVAEVATYQLGWGEVPGRLQRRAVRRAMNRLDTWNVSEAITAFEMAMVRDIIPAGGTFRGDKAAFFTIERNDIEIDVGYDAETLVVEMGGKKELIRIGWNDTWGVVLAESYNFGQPIVVFADDWLGNTAKKMVFRQVEEDTKAAAAEFARWSK